jgi:hypothetical protein
METANESVAWLISVWVGGFFFAMSASGQQLMYRQSFEEPIEQFQEIQWITPRYAVTQSVVSHLPKHRNFLSRVSRMVLA